MGNLRRWAKQPSYQLERRVDALLSPYLEAFLERRFGAGSLVKLVTSEFPIPKELLLKGEAAQTAKRERRHVSADFLLLQRKPKPRWILLELKTDMGSRKDKEDKNYAAIGGATMEVVLNSLEDVKQTSRFKDDYTLLVARVRALGHGKELIETHYLQPIRAGGDPSRVHTLREFADSRVGEGDELWTLLVKLLRGVVRSEKGRRSKKGRRGRSKN